MFRGTNVGTHQKVGLKNLNHNPFRYYWDPDALPYLRRLQRLVPVPMAIRKAWNEFVIDTKRSGWWQLQDLVYPVIGGTAATHALEAKGSGTYDITWQGNLTHSRLGVVGGNTGSGNTHWYPSVGGFQSRYTRNDASISCYQTESVVSVVFTAGAVNAGSLAGTSLAVTYGGNQSLSYINSLVGSLNTIPGNSRGGWLLGRRISSLQTDIFLNGKFGGITNATSQAIPTIFMGVMCRNSGIAPGFTPSGSTLCTVSFWSFGGSGGPHGFDIDATNQAVHKLQRALGREITL